MRDREPFDAAYYRRYYEEPRTRVTDAGSVARLAAFALAYLRYLRVPVRTVLDLGCGVGHWRTALAELAPRAKYHGVEFSEYQCERMGWERGSAVDYAPGKTFDLVVCQGVLQYLDDRQAARAIANFARLSGAALYVEALTRRDWKENVDRDSTDGAVHLRSGSWYRQRLSRHFVPVGGGLHVRRDAAVTLFELERLA